MEHRDGTMVLLAIFLSRFEAVEIRTHRRVEETIVGDTEGLSSAAERP